MSCGSQALRGACPHGSNDCKLNSHSLRGDKPHGATPLSIFVAEFVRIRSFTRLIRSLTTSATSESPRFAVSKILNGVARRGRRCRERLRSLASQRSAGAGPTGANPHLEFAVVSKVEISDLCSAVAQQSNWHRPLTKNRTERVARCVNGCRARRGSPDPVAWADRGVMQRWYCGRYFNDKIGRVLFRGISPTGA